MSILSIASVRSRHGEGAARAPSARMALGFVAVVHLAALAVLYETEWGYLHGTLALLSWTFLNALFLALLARPAMASTLALTVTAAVVAASLFKFEILWMGLSFFDVLIIDPDTVSYLLAIVPHARLIALVSILIAIPLLIA